MRLVEAEREPGEFVADLTVTGVEVVGAESYVFGALAEKGPEIAVRVPGYSHLEPGTKVRAAGRLDAVHRFDSASGRRLD
jgi:sn-glycerol 3-phosphate transport system ATP-binding protein